MTDVNARYRTSDESPGSESSPTPDPGLRVALHGPGVTIDDVIEAAEATKGLLAEVGRSMGIDEINWQVTSVFFQCDDCGLQRPDRPGPDEGWTYSDGDDLCPACTEKKTSPTGDGDA